MQIQDSGFRSRSQEPGLGIPESGCIAAIRPEMAKKGQLNFYNLLGKANS